MDELGTYSFTMTSDGPGWMDMNVKIGGLQGYLSEGVIGAIGEHIAERLTDNIENSGTWSVSQVSVCENRNL